MIEQKLRHKKKDTNISTLGEMKSHPKIFKTDRGGVGYFHRTLLLDVEPRICSVNMNKKNDDAEKKFYY